MVLTCRSVFQGQEHACTARTFVKLITVTHITVLMICRPCSFRCTPLLSNGIWCQYSTLLPYHLHSENFEMATFSGKEKSNRTSLCKMALNSSQEPQYIKSAGNIINRPRPEPYATPINTRK